MSTLTLKSWLFSKRTTNDEKAQPWGLILFLSNLILFFLGMMFIGAGIGIADHGTAAQNALMNSRLLTLPILCPLPTLALLGLRRFFKQRLAYGVCSGVIWASTLSTIASSICFIYLMNQVI